MGSNIPLMPVQETGQGLGEAKRVVTLARKTPALGGQGTSAGDEQAGGELWRGGAAIQPRVGSQDTEWGWGLGPPRQSAVVGGSGESWGQPPCSERGQIKGTPRALPDAVMGDGSTGR